jgi:ribosomal-protein-alanine N-acetyltransferase
MIENYEIRLLNTDDLSDMQPILLSASRDWTSSTLESCFEDSYLQWGIFFENTLLGFIIIKNHHIFWEMMQIVIDAEYQHQGLATQLMQAVILEARKKNVKTIQLEVRASNVSAISLYRKCGFVEVGVRKNYYQGKEDAILMDKITSS